MDFHFSSEGQHLRLLAWIWFGLLGKHTNFPKTGLYTGECDTDWIRRIRVSKISIRATCRFILTVVPNYLNQSHPGTLFEMIAFNFQSQLKSLKST